MYRYPKLPQEILDAWLNIEAHAKSFGLDFFPIIYEVLDYKTLYTVAARGGFPIRYPHWRFGMEFEELSKGHIWGLSTIYEMVINTNPSYAYLLEGNEMVTQKMVMAHVAAHVDFFKNNLWFAHTNRKMLDDMANNAQHITRFMHRFGQDQVEDFIDICLSLDNLIDYHGPYITRPPAETKEPLVEEEHQALEGAEEEGFKVDRYYMQDYINPPEVLEEQRSKKKAKREALKNFPEHPQKDVLLFLIQYAPMQRWQRTILEVIRDEAYYYAPQGMTKIMNEGWASYWHSRIMTEKVLTTADVIDFADHHAGVVATSPGRLNPYKLGLELLRNIEERWNKGRFGKEYEECDNMREKRLWDRQLGLGQQKIFEVRRFHNDVTFIDEFLTKEFVEEQKLFAFDHQPNTGYYHISSREFETIKERLLFQLTNMGQPYIVVEDGNFRNRQELLLKHRHEGVDLKVEWAETTLANLQKIWTRPVHIDTVVSDVPHRFSHDGHTFDAKKI